MHAIFHLKHAKHRDRRMDFEVYDVSCAEVCAVMQMPNPEKKIEAYMQNKLASKLPQSLYNFDVEGWEFV